MKMVEVKNVGNVYTGKTPSTSVKEYWTGNIPFITPTDIKDFNIRYNYNIERYVSEEWAKKSKKILPKDTVCFVCIGSTIGKMCLLKEPSTTNQQINSVVCFDEYDSKFIYYSLKSMQFLTKDIFGGGGAAKEIINKSTFEKALIPVPETKEKQKQIAKTLSDFDDKIELNNKMNQTLEQISQAIFKHWFIDFEFPNEKGKPYKSSGGKMVDSEMGKIPVGWKIGIFNDLINCTIGGDWGKEKEEGNYINSVKVIRGTDIPAIASGNKGRMPERYILDRIFKERGLKADDLVIEISGGSPDQSTGRITYISKEFLDRFLGNIICSNFCRAIRPKTSEDSNYLYNLWKVLYSSDIFFNFENGTTGIKNLDLNTLINNYKVIIPDSNVLGEFNLISKSIFRMVENNSKENETISQLRDSLLPRLMSGKINLD
jgi:type I restriction enzyme S subunit